jgi:hypothetical protein
MGAVVVLAPVLASAWPSVSASLLGAAAALGWSQANAKGTSANTGERVSIEVEGSASVTADLANDEKMTFVKGPMSLTFLRDARGACSVEVKGEGMSKSELAAAGREFAGQAVQQYAYHKLMTELQRRNFSVVSQEIGADRTIHVSVRRMA